MTYITPTTLRYQSFIDAALADGWVASDGPWGKNEHDRTVQLTKRMDELGGEIMISLVDRDFANRRYNRDTKDYDVTYTLDQHANAWFREDAKGPGYAKREQAFTSLNVEVYNLPELIKEVNSCNVCHREVGKANLIPVAFANAACVDCAPELSAKLETPGWYN